MNGTTLISTLRLRTFAAIFPSLKKAFIKGPKGVPENFTRYIMNMPNNGNINPITNPNTAIFFLIKKEI
jgi:hypothetical protein